MSQQSVSQQTPALEGVSFIRQLSQLATRLMTLFYGVRVGCDEAGNCYYRSRRRGENKREHRWVLYKGEPDPSRVPPEWFTWLHHTTNATLCDQPKHSWQRPHTPNLTGTSAAWKPPSLRSDGLSHQEEGAIRHNGIEAWSPAMIGSVSSCNARKG